MFTVVLEVRLRGVPVGSTEDAFEAESIEEAEARAVAAWKAARPGFTYAPLVTTAERR